MVDVERRVINVDDELRVAVCIQSLSTLGGKKANVPRDHWIELARRCRHKIGCTQHSTANAFDEVVRELGHAGVQVCLHSTLLYTEALLDIG